MSTVRVVFERESPAVIKRDSPKSSMACNGLKGPPFRLSVFTISLLNNNQGREKTKPLNVTSFILFHILTYVCKSHTWSVKGTDEDFWTDL